MLCPKCGLSLIDDRRSYLKHLSRSHKQEDCLCPLCNKEFKCLENLLDHDRKAHCDKKKCEECLMEFSNQGNLNSHKNSVHNKIKFSCKICTKEVSNLSNLKR